MANNVFIQKTASTRISWPLLGMVGRTIAKEDRCTSSNLVKGSLTWTSTFQTWTLFVVGAGSALLKDGTPECITLIEQSTTINSTSTNSTLANPTMMKSTSTKSTRPIFSTVVPPALPKTAIEPKGTAGYGKLGRSGRGV